MELEQIYAAYDWKEQRGTDQYKYCPLCGTQLTWKAVGGRTRRICPRCGFIHYRNPHPTVSVLVVRQDRVLLGKRTGEPGKGKWALPSGYIEFDEDFLGTAIGEVKEETGLDVEPVSILNVQSAFLPDEYHFLSIYLLARLTGGNLKAADDLEDAKWFPVSELFPEMAFPPDVKLIQAYFNGGVAGIPIHRLSEK